LHLGFDKLAGYIVAAGWTPAGKGQGYNDMCLSGLALFIGKGLYIYSVAGIQGYLMAALLVLRHDPGCNVAFIYGQGHVLLAIGGTLNRGVENLTPANRILAEFGVIVNGKIIVDIQGDGWAGTDKDPGCQNQGEE